jgi:hypothetical protein
MRWAASQAESIAAAMCITTDSEFSVFGAAAVRRQGVIASGLQPEVGLSGGGG